MSKPIVARGSASRPKTPEMLPEMLHREYEIDPIEEIIDLGGSSNLNLSILSGGARYVVRIYRPWVTKSRLTDMQHVRHRLAESDISVTVPMQTKTGKEWTIIEHRLVEVEPFIEHNGNMDSWEKLEIGLPWLGQIHTALNDLDISADGKSAPACNNIGSQEILVATMRGIATIREGNPSAEELQLAQASQELAELIASAEQSINPLPTQLVHGDFWDNNVFFSDERVVLINDFDFMGERPRIDDLALTLYYTNSTFSEGRESINRIEKLSHLVDVYNSGLHHPLTASERFALPFAIARTTLAFIAMIPSIDTEVGVRKMTAEITPDIAWALEIAHNPQPWQNMFA